MAVATRPTKEGASLTRVRSHRNNAMLMPKTEVVFYADDDRESPVMAWLDGLPEKVQDKLLVRIERLEEMGHELHRPDADYLRDGIYELRAKRGTVNYRILYFFAHNKAVLAHGLTKEKAVPDRDIELAARHKGRFEASPVRHTYEEK